MMLSCYLLQCLSLYQYNHCWFLILHVQVRCCFSRKSWLSSRLLNSGVALWGTEGGCMHKINWNFRFLAIFWLDCFSNAHFCCFASCNRSDSSVLVAAKSRRRIPLLILKKKQQLLKNNVTYSAIYTFTVVILRKTGKIHYHCFSWKSQLTFIGLTSRCPLTTPTKNHPHKFNNCDLFFVMLSALANFTKVKFVQNVITLRYFYMYLFNTLHAS